MNEKSNTLRVSVRLKKTLVDQLQPADKTYFVFDADLTGFGVRVSGTTKAFIVQRRVNGEKKRVTIGRYGELTVDQARTRAQELLGRMAGGEDILKERRKRQVKVQTLDELYRDFLKSRPLTDSTRKDYDKAMQAIGWEGKPWQSITGDQVLAKFRDLSARGGTTANRHLRALRSILNFGIQVRLANAETPPVNPCTVLSRNWNPSRPKTTTIPVHRLSDWYAAVQQLKNETAQDFLLFMLLTGLRREEGLTLPWAQVDFEARTLTIPDPKNHKPHTLPLSDFVNDLLRRRREAGPKAVYVFSSDYSQTGHYAEPKKAYLSIAERTGLHVTLHDLRRTFGTVGAQIVSPAELKALMNHRAKSDVTTTHYVHLSVERLREPMQRITDYFLTAFGLKQPSNIVPLIAKAKEG